MSFLACSHPQLNADEVVLRSLMIFFVCVWGGGYSELCPVRQARKPVLSDTGAMSMVLVFHQKVRMQCGTPNNL